MIVAYACLGGLLATAYAREEFHQLASQGTPHPFEQLQYQNSVIWFSLQLPECLIGQLQAAG